MSEPRGIAYVRNFRRRVSKKLDDVVEDVNYITTSLHELTVKLQKKAEHVLQDDCHSFSAYQELYNELEDISDKLFPVLNVLMPLCEETANLGSDAMKEANVNLYASSDERTDVVVFENTEKKLYSPAPSQHNILALDVENLMCQESKVFLKQSDNSCLDNYFINPTSESEEMALQTFAKNFDSCNKAHCEFQPRERFPYGMLSDSSYYSLSSFSNQEVSNSADNIYHHCSSSDFSHVSTSSVHESSIFTNHNGFASSRSQEVICVPDPDIAIGATYKSVIATNINSPSEFWVQLNNPSESKILFDMQKNCTFKDVSAVQLHQTVYCLAPSKRSGKYQRAKLATPIDIGSQMGSGKVQVHFLDFGYTEVVCYSELRCFPQFLLSYPVQAVCCSLCGVEPAGGEWSESAVSAFRNTLEYSDPQVTIIARCREKFLVTVSVMMPLPDGKEENSVADMLRLMGYAILPSDIINKSEIPAVQANENEQSVHLLQSFHKNHVKYDREISEEYSEANYSCKESLDEVVNIRLQPREARTNFDNLQLTQSLPASQNYEIIHSSSISSVSSCDATRPLKTSFHQPTPVPKIIPQVHEVESQFNWHLTIPDKEPVYVQQDIMLVNISAILNPSHFYVNVVSKNVAELDDLREHMTVFYEHCCKNAHYIQIFQLSVEDIEPGLFCCCRYPEDSCWYRARVEEILNSKEPDHCEVVVQYVDYGNKAIVNLDELYPLTSKFASYSSFAMACSLAGILPKIPETENKLQNENITASSGGWNSIAIRRFETLTMKEKCFTAEIVGDRRLANNRFAFDVILWDIVDGKDYMINDLLIDEGYAFLDVTFLPKAVTEQDNFGSAEALKSWDPMSEDYNSVLNSYGVDINDIEVQTLGYKAHDEKRICKFFSSNGRCLRGDSCIYEHIKLNYDCETLDQEDVFLKDNPVPLPKPGTHCLAQVSCVIDPGHFYLSFPYGTDGIIDNPGFLETHKRDFELLQEALRNCYSKAAFQEQTTVALAAGTIVAARSRSNDQWCRARIIEVEDIDKPVKVFFVDFGGTELVSRKDIQEIKAEFLYCPFQAIECLLANVVSAEKKWSCEAKTMFISLVKSKVLLAHVKERIGTVLYVTLQDTSKPYAVIINEAMVQYGFARYSSSNDIFNAHPSSLQNGTSINSQYHQQPG